jgi:hypothetical protein
MGFLSAVLAGNLGTRGLVCRFGRRVFLSKSKKCVFKLKKAGNYGTRWHSGCILFI